MTKRILFIATSSMNSRSGGGLANKALYNALEEQYPGCVDVVIQEDGYHYPDNFFLIKRPSLLKRIFNTITCKLEGDWGIFVYDLIDRNPGKYTLCIINVGLWGNMVQKLHQKGLKVVTIHHNYEPKFQRDNRSSCSFLGTFTHFISKVEKKSYLDSDMNLFLTRSDLECFEKEYGYRSNECNHVIGIFETERHKRIIDNTSLPVNKLVICGSLCSVQTVIGVKSFEHECLPILHNYYNNKFSLTFTGRNPGKYITDLVNKDRNLIIEANPTDISTIVKQSGIFICPTNVGGGLKLRIMDGLKLGLPVITHEVSARGYDKFFGRDWFQIYNDSTSFFHALEKVTNLIKSCPDIRQEIIDYYYQVFSFEKGKKSYLDHIEKIYNVSS